MNRQFKIGVIFLSALGILLGWLFYRRSYPVASPGPSAQAITQDADRSDQMLHSTTPETAPASYVPASNQQSDDARLRSNIDYVNRIFEPVLPAFRLDDAQRRAVRALIVEWLESRHDAAAIVLSKPIGEINMPDAVRLSSEDVEKQLKTIVPQAVAESLVRMLRAGGAIEQVANNWAPRLQKLGYPLSPEQRLELGLSLHAAYDRQDGPNLPLREFAPVDINTGLSTLDTIVIQRISTILTPPQVEAIQTHLVQVNRRVEQMKSSSKQ